LWENLSFNHTESLRDSIDHFFVENVHSCIDFVTDELFWFLYESCDSIVWVSDYNAESTWLFDSSKYNGGQFIMTLMELKEFLKWIITENIAVKDKKDIGSCVAFDNFLG